MGACCRNAGAPPHIEVPLLTELPRIASEQDAPPLLRVAPTVDPALPKSLIAASRDPRRRFASGDDLREALEALRPREGQSAPRRKSLPRPARIWPSTDPRFRSHINEIGTIIDRLRTKAFVLVAADSGVGKSSALPRGYCHSSPTERSAMAGRGRCC